MKVLNEINLNRLIYGGITASVMIVFLLFGLTYIQAGIITFVLMVGGYLMWAISRQKRRLALLTTDNNPEAFVEATKRQQKLMPKAASILDVDIACGYIEMGNFQEARELLEAYSGKMTRSVQYAYYHNLCLCLYELGDNEKADTLYAESVMKSVPLGRLQEMSQQLLIATYFHHRGDFEMEQKVLTKLLSRKGLSEYMRLHVYASLGMMYEIKGELETAENNYAYVAGASGTLHITKRAQAYLESVREKRENNEKSIGR